MKVTFKHPNLPKGEGVGIPGLNVLLKNGEAVEVSDEVIAEYEAATGNKFEDVVNSAAFTGKQDKAEKENDTTKETATESEDK
jgi:hypothetical protein